MENFVEKKENIHQQALRKLNEAVSDGYILHGSGKKLEVIEPRQATDTSGTKHKNFLAVYGSDTPRMAIAAALIHRKDKNKGAISSWSGNKNRFEIGGDDNIVLAPGYVHILPSETFEGHHGEDERDYEIVSMKPVEPIEVVEVTPEILDYMPEVHTKLPRQSS